MPLLANSFKQTVKELIPSFLKLLQKKGSNIVVPWHPQGIGSSTPPPYQNPHRLKFFVSSGTALLAHHTCTFIYPSVDSTNCSLICSWLNPWTQNPWIWRANCTSKLISQGQYYQQGYYKKMIGQHCWWTCLQKYSTKCWQTKFNNK